MTNKKKLYKATGLENDQDAMIYGIRMRLECCRCPIDKEKKCKDQTCLDNIKDYLEEVKEDAEIH